MKENQTKTVVCAQCGQPHEVAVKHSFLFYEEWQNALPLNCALPSGGHVTHNPYNLSNEEWEVCCPTVTMQQFIRQLHDRVTALETAIAEKGGER